jgi:late competence protein required for DNA uptake (superfamily II DNA/RNA helicase)
MVVCDNCKRDVDEREMDDMDCGEYSELWCFECMDMSRFDGNKYLVEVSKDIRMLNKILKGWNDEKVKDKIGEVVDEMNRVIDNDGVDWFIEEGSYGEFDLSMRIGEV